MEVFFVIVVIGVVVAIVVSSNRKANEAWQSTGESLRLEFVGTSFGGRLLTGSREGYSVRVETERHGKQTWTGYRVKFGKAIDFPGALKPQGFLSGMTNALTNQIDLEVGDKEFDARFVVTGAEDGVRKFLDEDRRERLLHLARRFGHVELNAGQLLTRRNSSVSSNSILFEDIQKLEAAAALLMRPTEELGPVAKPVPPPLPKQDGVEVVVLEEAPKEVPAGEPVEIESVFEMDETAEDPVVEVEAEPVTLVDAESGRDEEKDKEKEKDKEREVGGGEDLLFQQRCREVIGGSAGRYAATKRFEEELKGSTFDERLTLFRAEPFAMDRHLGRGPGVKRVFSLGRIEEGAELWLAADSGAEAELAGIRVDEGRPVRVQAEFLSYDPFSSTIYARSTRE